MIYKIQFSDNTFMLVDENFTLCLWRNAKAKKPIKINIKDFIKTGYILYNNFVFIDAVDGVRIPLSFSISTDEIEEDLPLYKRYKYTENLKVGDLVEGPDGPRHVKDLHRGEEEMYDIVIDGKKYTVNGGHILHLIDKDTKEPLDIQLNVYLHMDDEFKSHYQMEKITE